MYFTVLVSISGNPDKCRLIFHPYDFSSLKLQLFYCILTSSTSSSAPFPSSPLALGVRPPRPPHPPHAILFLIRLLKLSAQISVG